MLRQINIRFTSLSIAFLVLLSMTLIACSDDSSSEPEVITKEVEVIKEVEVVKEVPVEKEVEVIKEVEVVKEVPGKTVLVEKEIEVVKEVPTDPGSLVLYSGRSEKLVGAVVEQFEAVTGIDVQVKYGKTFPVALMILEEGDKSPADIYWAQDRGGLGFMSAEGRLSKLPADISDLAYDWAKPKDGSWVGLSGRARTLVHTATIADSDLPSSLEDLTDPKWKGKIGWAPTNSSFQTMITGMRAAWGEEKTRQWLADVQANEPIVYPKNTPQVAAAAEEEISIGMVNHYYLHRFIADQGDTFNARNLYLNDGGPGSLIMVAGAGIVNTASNKENAEKFLKFMLSPVAQQYFTGQVYEYPVVDGVKVHKFLNPIGDMTIPDLSMEDLSDLEGTQAILKELGILF